MKIETIDLHNLNLEEALRKVEMNLQWCIDHNVDVIDIIHGKGRHSQQNFSVIKQEVRRKLKNESRWGEQGYKIIPGESNYPVALTFDEGHTLIVYRGKESDYIGGAKTRQKNKIVYSEEGKKMRKNFKKQNAHKKRK